MKRISGLITSRILPWIRPFFVLALVLLVAAFVSGTTLAAEPTGRLEIKAMLNSEDVSSRCRAMLTPVNGSKMSFLSAEDGLLVAEVKPGSYELMVLAADKANQVHQWSGTVQVVEGKTNQKTVKLSVMNIPQIPAGAFRSNLPSDDEEWDEEDSDETDEELYDDESEDFGGLVKVANLGTSIDLDEVMSEDALVALAEAYKAEYYEQLSSLERPPVDAELRKLEWDEPVRTQVVGGLTTAGSVIAATGASKEISVVFAAAAVVAVPDAALTVNNFGAILRLLQATEESIQVLNYGRTLDPESPLVWTNLANSLFEVGDLENAKACYEEAIRLDEDYSLAHQGLGQLWLVKKDWRKALDEFVKGAEVGWGPMVEEGYDKAKEEMGDSDGGPVVTPPWAGQGGDGPSAGGKAGSYSNQIEIPRYPDPKNADDLASMNESLRKWHKSLQEKQVELGRRSVASQKSRPSAPASGMSISYDKYRFQLSLLQEYYEAKITEVVRPGELYNLVYDLTNWGLMDDEQVIVDKYLNSGMDISLACKPIKEVRARWFAKWNSEAKPAYVNLQGLLQQFWVDSAPLMSRIASPYELTQADIARQAFVYSHLSDLVLDLVSVADAFAGDLSKLTCAPPDGGAGPWDTDLPSAKADCPFKNGKKLSIAFPIIPITFKVDCETVSLEAAAGLAAGFTYNFKHDQVTSIFVGIGGNISNPGVVPGYSAVPSLGGKVGVEFTFSGDSVTSITPVAGANLGLGINDISPLNLGVGLDTSSGLSAGLGPIDAPSPF